MNRRQDVKRILLEHIRTNRINYKYLLTLDYYYKQKDYNKVLLDNKHLRRTIRKFYKDDISMMFFIEKHTKPESNHYGGYHRHILVEDATNERWKEPSNGMMNLLLNLDPTAAFAMKMNLETPNEEVKGKLLCKVCRVLMQSVPNGYIGSDATPITEDRGGITGLINYLTKQVDMFHPAYEVIDVSNSRVNPTPLLNLYPETSGLCGGKKLVLA
jgi:hypothetical protein